MIVAKSLNSSYKSVQGLMTILVAISRDHRDTSH